MISLSEIQKMLDLVVSVLMGGIARFASPTVILSDEDTASTDGKAYVKLPLNFLGQPLIDQMENAVALLAHEVGHWLQPLSEIQEVEKHTGFNGDVSNLLLDIQLEENVVRIFPLFSSNLQGLREAIKRKSQQTYVKELKQADKDGDFLSTAIHALLLGRFCGDTSESFTIMLNHVSDERVMKFIQCANEFKSLRSSDLPLRIASLAKEYPELCQPPVNGNFGSIHGLNPTSAVSSGNVEGLAEMLKSAVVIYDGFDNCNHNVGALKGRIAPEPDVLAASRSIQKRWEVPRSAGTMMGPGRLNRLAAVRGDPIPFEVPGTRGRTQPRVKVVLIADFSSSMLGRRWQETRKAAQAVTIAVRNSGGDVRGAVFEGYLMHDKDFDAEVFFSRTIGGQDLSNANGISTSFGWLPLVWQTFPDYRIVLLTDGNGLSPTVIPAACRKRTSAILLQVDNYDRKQVEGTVCKFAEKFVHVNKLDELAAAWSLVIPRLA
jgi:hypothetical protein